MYCSQYTWGLNIGGGIGGLLNLKQSGQYYNYLYDGKGNIMAVIDSNQQPVAYYRYDVFGEPMKKVGTLNQPFRFSTKRYDEATGLYNFGYRFYNPITGTWMTRDPLGEAGGINLYQVANNSPINFVDPWGLWSFKIKGYYGVGGSLTIGRSDGQWFARGALGFGLGGGLSYRPTGSFPGPEGDSKRGFIGGSGWLGCSVGPASGGWSGTGGLQIQGGEDGRPKLTYVEKGGWYGSLVGKTGWGLRLGGGLNIFDVGIAWE